MTIFFENKLAWKGLNRGGRNWRGHVAHMRGDVRLKP